MSYGASAEIVDNNGQTPIYYAIRYGRFEMVEFLIQNNTNINLEDKKNQTPLMWAKKYAKQQILELLLSHGAAPVSESKKSK